MTVNVNDSEMCVRSICYFKTRDKRRATRVHIREKDPSVLNDVKGLKEESGGKKVDQF